MDAEEFILGWLEEHGTADVLDSAFHDEFHRCFGGARISKNWGSQPVRKAMRLLADMHIDGKIQRYPVGLPEHEIGFPNWVYVYGQLK